MSASWLHRLTAIYAAGLLFQGGINLAFRLIPALDQAMPVLLATTQMTVSHALMHLATGLLALVIYRIGDTGREWLFLVGFGLYYTSLGLAGFLTGGQFGLGLSFFDHPIHLVIGVIALASAISYRWRMGSA